MAQHWQPGNSDLPASGVTAGTYGDATHSPQVAVNAAGLITAASNVVIAGGGGTAGLVSLFDSTLGVAAASIDTGAGGIAAGHKDLLVFAMLGTTENVPRSIVTWLINNDTGNNYDRQFLSASATAGAAGTQLAQPGYTVFVHGTGGTGTYPGVVTIMIPSYDQTVFYKVGTITAQIPDGSAANNQSELDSLGYRSTAAISRMSVTAPGGFNLAAGSRLVIYGTA